MLPPIPPSAPLLSPLPISQGGLGNTSGDASGLSVTAKLTAPSGTLAWAMAFKATLDANQVLTSVPAAGAPGLVDASTLTTATLVVPRQMATTGNEFTASFQASVPSNTGTQSYEKAALYCRIAQADPSDYANGYLKDAVAIEGQARILSGNMAGRAWAFNCVTRVLSGGDGYAAGMELAVYNDGVAQPLINQINSKNGLHLVAGGSQNLTGAIVTETAGVKWQDGVVVKTNTIVNAAFAVRDLSGSSPVDLASIFADGSISATRYTTASGKPLILQVPGTGALQLNPTDGTAANGSARGQNAIDLQIARTGATQVASGAYSFVAGNGNVASGSYGVAIGQQNSATGPASIALGGTGNVSDGQYSGCLGGFGGKARGRWGVQFFSSGFNSVAGDAQIAAQVLYGAASGTSAFRLTAGGAAANATNVANLPASAAGSYHLKIAVHVYDVTNPANTFAWSLPIAILTKTGSANSTTVLTLGTPVTLATNSWAPTVSATADTTNGGLNISVTPPSGNADTIHAVARVESVEVQ